MRMVGDRGYGDMDYILAELEEAEQLFRRNRQWTLINITNKAATLLRTGAINSSGQAGGAGGDVAADTVTMTVGFVMIMLSLPYWSQPMLEALREGLAMVRQVTLALSPA